MIKDITQKLLRELGFSYNEDIKQFSKEIDDNDGYCVGTIAVRFSKECDEWIIFLLDQDTIGWENVYSASHLVEKIFEFGIKKGRIDLKTDLRGLLGVKCSD